MAIKAGFVVGGAPRRSAGRAGAAAHPARSLFSFVTILALLFGLVTLATALAPQEADAYTPSTIEPTTSPANPPYTTSLTATLEHSLVNGSQPKPGDTFTYTARYPGLPAVYAGTSTTTVITVHADSNAPFTTVPTVDNFRLNGAAVAGGSPSTCSRTSCTFTFTNLGAGDLTFSHTATMGAVPSGTLIGASTRIERQTTPTAALSPGSFGATSPQTCEGPIYYSQVVGGSGGFLTDIKFADAAGLGKVQLVNPGTALVAGVINPAQSTRGDRIQIIAPGGLDITSRVLGRATYIGNDPSKSRRPDQIITQYPNARFLDSLNFPFNPEAYTGHPDVYLAPGTEIRVQREIKYTGCVLGRFSADLDTERPFGVSILIEAPFDNADAYASDLFAFGTVAASTCVDVYRSSTQGRIYKLVPGQSDVLVAEPNRVAAGGHIPALAISPLHPERLYYYRFYDRATQPDIIEFGYYDTRTGGYTYLNLPSGVSTAMMAFDRSGTLWVYGDNSVLYSLPDGASTPSGWVNHGPISGAPQPSGDIAFDSAGNLLFLSDIGRIYTVPASELTKTSGVSTSPGYLSLTGASPSGWSRFYGIAFDGQGRLLVSYFSGNNLLNPADGRIYSVNRTTGALTQVSTPTGHVGTQDMASCAFAPAPAGYKVQKTVINPDGSIQPVNGADGSTPGATRTVDADGTVTVDYLVTVTATGGIAGPFPRITDNVRVPKGFTITGVDVTPLAPPSAGPTAPQGASGTFTIDPAQLDPAGTSAPVARTYRVSVTARATDLNGVDWIEAANCSVIGAGNPLAGGFFNRVTMTNDSDGANNNDACAPIEPPGAKLTLIKRIVDGAGNELLSRAGDAKFFDLLAAGPTGISGTSATSGDIAVTSPVRPGTYQLHEQGNDAGVTTGGYTFGTWSCVDRAVPLTLTGDQVVVGQGADVTCTVTNTPEAKVHVVKTASTPTADNTHIGATITPEDDGTFTATYVVTVTNRSDFVVDTGPINDFFAPPAGVIWDGTKTAPITYNANGTSATVLPGLTNASEVQLRNGANLARSIENLPAGASVTFTIAIPLKVDTSIAQGQTESNYELNRERLGQCTDLTSTGGNAFTDVESGIPNLVTLVREDLTYSDIAIEDNVACIPVVVIVPIELRIEKLDPNLETGPLAGAAFDIHSATPEGTLGAKLVTATEYETGRFKAELDPDIDYFLVETKSPTAYELLSQPVRFRLARVDGLATVTIYDQAQNLAVSAGVGQADIAFLQVADVKIGSLPKTGGTGPLWWLVGGIGLLVLALLSASQGALRPRRRTS